VELRKRTIMPEAAVDILLLFSYIYVEHLLTPIAAHTAWRWKYLQRFRADDETLSFNWVDLLAYIPYPH
jgi:hypothetical protein